MTPPIQTQWIKTFLLWGAGLGAAAQYAKISVVFDRLPLVYPEGGVLLGWAVSRVGLIGIFFGVAADLLVARIRYRRALIAALWLGAGVSAFQALLPPLEWFLFARAIETPGGLRIQTIHSFCSALLRRFPLEAGVTPQFTEPVQPWEMGP